MSICEKPDWYHERKKKTRNGKERMSKFQKNLLLEAMRGGVYSNDIKDHQHRCFTA